MKKREKTEEQLLDAFCAEIRAETVPDELFRTLEDVVAEERGKTKIIRFRKIMLRSAASIAAVLGIFYGITALSNPHCEPWKVTGISANRNHQPMVRNKRIITLKNDGAAAHVAVLDKFSGKTLWKSPFSVSSYSIGADRKRVFAWDSDALVAMDAGTGSELWRYEPRKLVQQRGKNLSVIGNTVCWTEGGNLFAVKTDSGKLAWQQKTGAGKLSEPVGNRNEIFSATKGRLLAFDRKTGAHKWEKRFETKGIRLFDPLVKCNKTGVYVAQRGFFGRASLTRLNVKNGHTEWERDIEGTLQSLSVRKNVFVKTDRLEVFDGTSGAPLWNAPIEGCAPPTPVDGRVYVVEGRGTQKIQALDAETGLAVWTQKLADSCNGLIVSGGMAFLSGHDGVLYALSVK